MPSQIAGSSSDSSSGPAALIMMVTASPPGSVHALTLELVGDRPPLADLRLARLRGGAGRGIGRNHQRAALAIDHRFLAVRHRHQSGAEADHHRDAARAGQQGDVAGRAAAGQRDGRAGLPIDAEEARRRQVARHQDGARRDGLLHRAGQDARYPVAQVGKVGATGAEIFVRPRWHTPRPGHPAPARQAAFALTPSAMVANALSASASSPSIAI